jgi:hypothetical protein
MKTLVALALLLAPVATSSAQSFGRDPDPNVQFELNRDAQWKTAADCCSPMFTPMSPELARTWGF